MVMHTFCVILYGEKLNYPSTWQRKYSDSDTLTRTSGSLGRGAVGNLGRIGRGTADYRTDADADGTSKKAERTNGERNKERRG